MKLLEEFNLRHESTSNSMDPMALGPPGELVKIIFKATIY